jgi:hypothetical protein
MSGAHEFFFTFFLEVNSTCLNLEILKKSLDYIVPNSLFVLRYVIYFILLCIF